jgi:hypothetical protein
MWLRIDRALPRPAGEPQPSENNRQPGSHTTQNRMQQERGMNTNRPKDPGPSRLLGQDFLHTGFSIRRKTRRDYQGYSDQCRLAPIHLCADTPPAAPSDRILCHCALVVHHHVHSPETISSAHGARVLEEIHLDEELHVTALCTLQFLERLRTREPEKPRTL